MALQEPVRMTIKGRTIELTQGDISRETADAIVNAANSELLPGGGVCGAIHRGGGPKIAEECGTLRRERGPVRTGGAVATTAGKLAARHVIHAVGPIWEGGRRGERDSLASCYRESLHVADGLQLKSIAFPAISTGIFGYPVAEAAAVALKTVFEILPKLQHVETVRFVLFDQSTFDAFTDAARHVVRAAS
jgi:O-acetyl-ADP-ribose deacetylase (regulator of RNase III)